MDFVKFEDNPNLIRDMNSKAVLVTDSGALQAHLRQRNQFNRIDLLEIRIENIEDKLNTIIQLMSKV